MDDYIEREAVLVGIENEYKNVEKIKTPFAKIIVEGTVEKPYYSILWLDKENKEYNVGYSSYCLDYVFKWMEVVFEIVAADEPLTAEGAPVQKWIPVTERLPEEEGLYLVAVVNDHERRYSKTAWYHGHGNWFLHQKVTHWMLLPEPPKEE